MSPQRSRSAMSRRDSGRGQDRRWLPLAAVVLLITGVLLLLLAGPMSPPAPGPSRDDRIRVSATRDEPSDVEFASVEPQVSSGSTEEPPERDGSPPAKSRVVRLLGTVVGPGGEPMVDAKVIVRPLGFYPSRAERLEAFGTRTDSHGEYSLGAIPAATHYTVYSATDDGSMGMAYVPREAAANRPTRIDVHPVMYRRCALFDMDGKPVAARELGVTPPTGGEYIADSTRPLRPVASELLAELGLGERPREDRVGARHEALDHAAA